MTAQPQQPRADITRRQAWLALITITLLGALLRCCCLGLHSLWYDEAFTAWTAAQAPRDILWISLQDVVHPPLYYLLLHLATAGVGSSEFGLRLLSAAASLLGIPLLYQLGRRGWDRRTGLAAALLWACAPFVIWYAQEARMYALLTTLSLAAIICLERALPRGNRRWLLANALLNLAGLYLHYFHFFALLGQYLYLALNLRRYRRTFWRWFLYNALAGLLYLPWLIAIWQGNFYRAQIAWVEPLSLATAWQVLLDLAVGKDQAWSLPAAVILLLLATGLLAAGLLARGRRRSAVPGLAWLQLLLPLALVALISLRQPLFYSRFLQIVLPALFLLVAAGLMHLPWRRIGAVLLILLLLAFTPTLYSMYTVVPRAERGWDEAMDYLAAQAGAGEAVAFRGGQGWHAYWYYYDGPPLDRISLAPEDDLAVLAAQAAGARRVWLVAWDPLHECRPPDLFVPAAEAPLQLVETRCFPAVLLLSFSPAGAGSGQP
jgi:mannosyltransferase